MQVKLEGANSKIQDCVDFVNDLFHREEFYHEISEKEHLDYTTYAGKQIASILESDQSEISIKFYKSKWRWSKANAYVSPNFKNTLFLNTRKLGRSSASIVNTIVHECVHVADNNDNNQENFGHGDNYSIGKDNSAPYFVGELAAQFYKNEIEGDIEIEEVEIDPNRIVDFT